MGADPVEAAELVEGTIQNRFVDRTITSIDRDKGGLILANTKLSAFANKTCGSIITPSGSVYDAHYERISHIATFAEDGLALRKVLKKKQFECKAAGDNAGANQALFAQTQVKINLNSLPGGFGSPFNIFNDKGGYNSITSVARALIAHAYTTCELCLGGNLAIFDLEEFINWIVINTSKMPSNDKITEVTERYKIKWANPSELFDYIYNTLLMYNPSVDPEPLKEIIHRLTRYQIQYLYYLGNLPHLFFNNDGIMRHVIKNILSHETFNTDGIEVKDFKNINGEILAVAMTIRAKELSGINIKKIDTDYPDLAKLIVATARNIETRLNDLNDLFETFVYSNVSTQKIMTRRHMKRRSVVVSDTDSIIFTAKNWLLWYTGSIEGLTQESYDIAALATYLLTKINQDSMAKYAIDCGATGKYVRRMRMKNEFLYPILIIYDIKKTYCGVIKVQEGVMLHEGELDLKGGSLRSSNIPRASLKFTEDFIVNDILKPAEFGRLKATKLINKVLQYELGIRDSLNRLETTYVERKSINLKSSYKKAESSAWVYAEAWNDVFADKYGVFHPPDKVAILKLLLPTDEYYEYVKRTDADIYKRMIKFVESNGKFPTGIVIPNSAAGIPKELAPIINVREIIYMNMSPTYITLERLNIHIGYSNNTVLLSDIYSL
jgi:hypothetical protein